MKKIELLDEKYQQSVICDKINELAQAWNSIISISEAGKQGNKSSETFDLEMLRAKIKEQDDDLAEAIRVIQVFVQPDTETQWWEAWNLAKKLIEKWSGNQ